MPNSDSNSDFLTSGVRILVVALSGIGNLLMQMPALETLKRKRPDSHITLWVAPRGTRKLAESLPYIDEIIEVPIKNSITGHIQFIQKLRSRHFTTGIVLSPGQLLKSAAYLWLAGIPQRIGSSYPLNNNPHSHFLLTSAIDEDPNLHDIEQNLRLLKPLGIESPLATASLRTQRSVDYHLQPSSSQQIEAHKILDRLSLEPGRNLIGFHMGSAPDFPWKRWPLENFIDLGKELISRRNAHILLFGGPDEEDIKRQISQALGNHASSISADLLTTAAIMQQCQTIVSNDSGLMHLAAAAGAIVFGLFGPTSEKHTGPRGAKSGVIRAPGTVPVYDTEINYNLGSHPHETMKAITVQMVLNKLSI